MRTPLAGLVIVAAMVVPLEARAQSVPESGQVMAALAPLPAEFRESATVLGYRAGIDSLIVLRQGSGPFICLADDPADDRFHTACYHRSLEPFMARGRALRAEGMVEEVDSIRYAEVYAGTLAMPDGPAALFSLTGDASSFDAATGEVAGAQPLYVVYIPFATAESTGLPTKPAPNTPWIMFPGTPKAHIMFVPGM
jgi:hypothetical protein